jgi:DNA repair photolyase
LRRDALRIKPGSLVTMSGSSDPYPHQERDLQITRGCLKVLKSSGLGVQVLTKSDLVCRDADLLREMKSVVSITITTVKDDLSRTRPGALPARMTLRLLRKKGVPVSARIVHHSGQATLKLRIWSLQACEAGAGLSSIQGPG